MKKIPSKSIMFAIPLLVATSAIANPFRPLENLDPVADGFNTNTVTGWFRGWEFTVAADDIVVTELGLNTPATGDTVMLELWDSNTQQKIASYGPVTTVANTWQYFTLDNSVSLTNGGMYTVGIFSEGTASYFYQNNLPGGWYPSGDINYQTMRYHNNTFSSWPTSTLNGYQYGVPDIGYVIPGPASAALLALGLFARRRRR